MLVSLANGFLSPGSPIPEGGVRAPFEAINPSWAGDQRLANFEKVWGIVYTETEIGGIEVEVASSNQVNFVVVWTLLQTGELKYPSVRDPCETRPYPR